MLGLDCLFFRFLQLLLVCSRTWHLTLRYDVAYARPSFVKARLPNAAQPPKRCSQTLRSLSQLPDSATVQTTAPNKQPPKTGLAYNVSPGDRSSCEAQAIRGWECLVIRSLSSSSSSRAQCISTASGSPWFAPGLGKKLGQQEDAVCFHSLSSSGTPFGLVGWAGWR